MCAGDQVEKSATVITYQFVNKILISFTISKLHVHPPHATIHMHDAVSQTRDHVRDHIRRNDGCVMTCLT